MKKRIRCQSKFIYTIVSSHLFQGTQVDSHTKNIEAEDKLMETMNDNDDHNKIILTIHKPLMMFMTLKMMKRLKTLNILKRMKTRIYF